MPNTRSIVAIEPNFTKGNESAVLLKINPKAIEKSILINTHNENIALFLEDKPIDIEYIDAVIARVASVGFPCVFHTSKKNGSKGTSICRIIQVKNSVISSLTP